MKHNETEAVVLETTREGYAIEQLGAFMTVGELIGILEEYDEDTAVIFSNDDGYTYGNIYSSDIYYGRRVDDPDAEDWDERDEEWEVERW